MAWANVIEINPPTGGDKKLRFITPIEQHKGIYVKREDMFEIAGIRGGKVRACWALSQGAVGLVTAGSRQSPQCNIVAQIAKHLKVPCHVHTANGELGPEVKLAVKAGAIIHQWDMGYSNVLACRARNHAKELGYTEIPFGMECQESISQTRRQVKNLPKGMRRVVVCVGSGMSLAGVLWGLQDEFIKVPVLGVRVGGGVDQEKFSPVLRRRLDRYAPPWWRRVRFVHAGGKYDEFAKETMLGTLKLDPIYEAKCLPFLEKGDLFWVVGIRQAL